MPDQNFLEKIIARSARENHEARTRIQSRLQAARDEAKHLAAEIGSLNDVVYVIHFGSSANGRAFRLDSDIDLAVSGGDIFEAMSIAESSRFHVDVIDIDRIPSLLKDAILAQGTVLYEKC